MNCTLCQREIEQYNPSLHHVELEALFADICNNCEDRLLKWHGEKLAKLFPTKTMKKLYGK